MDKIYRKYREQMEKNPQIFTDDFGIEIPIEPQADTLGMGVIRKENDLSNDEKHFLSAIERGDMASVKTFLEESQIFYSININCVDPLGRSGLLISIESENVEMIDLLLSYGVEIGDALLHAINEENVEAVELLMQYQVSKKKNLAGYLGGTPSDSFTPDITPIILAAHRDNYEILKILLDRGDHIPKPHGVRCSCRECIADTNEDVLRHSRSRINAYRALTSPSLISLSSKDPILTAFELSWELKRLSHMENEFKVEYEDLAKQCREFGVALLDQTRGSHELSIILNHDSETIEHSDESNKMTLSRLKLAIKYKQKKFVAHPNCQQLLASLWYQGLPGFRRKNTALKLLMTSAIGMVFPVFCIIYMIAPKSGLSNLIRKPFIKFIIHSSSYFTFLLLLILASQRISFSEEPGTNMLQKERRGAPPTYIECLIMCWVAGLIWSEVKQLWDVGAKEYIQDMWNLLDFATNMLYITTITLRVIAYIKVEEEKRVNDPRAYLRRSDWDAFDPNLIAEGLFSAANIFSSLKLIYIFTVNPHLGPLQISLGRMVVDIVKFFFVFTLVLFSFACGLNQLYWYYAAERQQECQSRPSGDCDNKRYKALLNLWEIAQTLYWGIYNMIDLEHFTLKEDHYVTQLLGKFMYGTYSLIAVVVLLNMLIAMMSNSYEMIYNQADTEWKFARSKLWMSYFEEGGTLPAPFNIVPTPKSLWYIVLWFKNCMCSCTKEHKRSKWHSIRKLIKRINERENKYQMVMKNLIKRYIMQRQRNQEDRGVTEDEINEIKTDISSFRFELLEILRNNGMKTPQYTAKPGKLEYKKSRGRLSLQRFQRRPIDSIPEESISKPNPVMKMESETMNDVTNGPNDPVKVDEGIGESFDQQSQLSDTSRTSNSSEDLTTNHADDMKSSEVILDPERLQDDQNGAAVSPFLNKKTGSIKRVSFKWQNAAKLINGKDSTYHYNGIMGSSSASDIDMDDIEKSE
uniref:Transient receptor potential channel C n=1 Tax=Terebratalia transversa TaxID=34513 RepID=M9UTP5_TERTR|nr:transient receptor potential channel C [Terebratalia transversa]